jgi:hypothetical protein
MKKARKKAYLRSQIAVVLGVILIMIGFIYMASGPPDTMTVYFVLTGLGMASLFVAIIFLTRSAAIRAKERDDIIKRLEEKLDALEKTSQKETDEGESQ